jgi:hypothetical protein
LFVYKYWLNIPSILHVIKLLVTIVSPFLLYF